MTYHNDNVLEIIQLSYENENSTARWRARNSLSQSFLDAIYLPTLLDQKLAPAILNDDYDLVVITGNPGDGKTAFLDRLDQLGRTRSNRPVNILHDATQPDPNDPSRSAMAEQYLEFFLDDLTDARWQPDLTAVRVVGINEGMLARTILNPKGKFANKLGQRLHHRKSSKKSQHGIGSIVVNLNDRALVHLPLGSEGNLVTGLLGRLIDPTLWENGTNGENCSGCPASAVCPFLTNVQLMRLSRPGRQLELLFAIAQFRRQRHVSLRDALAAISYFIVGHEDMYRGGDKGTGRPIHPCDYIQLRAEEERWGHLCRRLFYNSAFNDGDIFEGYFKELGETDEESHRLYGFANHFMQEELGSELDPAEASNAAMDAIELEVVSNPVGAILEGTAGWMTGLTELERRFFGKLSEKLKEIDDLLAADEVTDDQYRKYRESFLRLAYVTARSAKRRAFFFDSTLKDKEITPYESLEEFFGVLSSLAGSRDRETERAFDRAVELIIPGGIIASERISIPPQIENLQVRLGDEQTDIGARLDFHLEDTPSTILPYKDAKVDRHDYRPILQALPFVEYFPTFFVYHPFPDGSEHLVIALDLYELLYRLCQGFSETFGGQLRVQQLRVFKGALKARHAQRITLFDREDPNVRVLVNVQESRSSERPLPRVRFQ